MDWDYCFASRQNSQGSLQSRTDWWPEPDHYSLSGSSTYGHRARVSHNLEQYENGTQAHATEGMYFQNKSNYSYDYCVFGLYTIQGRQKERLGRGVHRPLITSESNKLENLRFY